jgi:hypothetical protein
MEMNECWLFFFLIAILLPSSYFLLVWNIVKLKYKSLPNHKPNKEVDDQQ